MEEIKFTLCVRGEGRIEALKRLIAVDHSSKTAVLNKALDLLIKTNDHPTSEDKSES